MKRTLLLLVAFLSVASFTATAQEAKSAEFNQWYIDAGIGLTKPYKDSAPGYYSPTPGFFAGEIGARYMFNEYFGLKALIGYNQFSDAKDSKEYKTTYMRYNVEAVANLGNMLNFSTFTQKIGLLGHVGGGIATLNYDAADNNEKAINGVAGLTVQYKLNDKISINADGSVMANAMQDRTFDGMASGSKGAIFNGTVGVSYSLGKETIGADSYNRKNTEMAKLDAKINALSSTVSTLEEETVAKDELKSQIAVTEIEEELAEIKSTIAEENSSTTEIMAQLINDGIANIYFAFNSTKVQETSVGSIALLKSYLKNNSNVSIVLTGYADEKGSESFNQSLSEKRAKAVATALENAGISSSRLTVVGKGEYKDISKSTKTTDQLSRRVSVSVK